MEIPTAIAIGTLITSSTLAGDVDPVIQWTMAAIAGGGAAGTIAGVTSATRLASTGLTAGTGNFMVSTLEDLSAVVLSLLALALPFLAVFVVIFILGLGFRKLFTIWEKRSRR